MIHTLSKRPLTFAMVTVALYAVLLLPLAASRDFDLSAFVFAGDAFVSRARITAPIVIAPHSIGYDGQFFYRFALNPLSIERSAYGITLDGPAKRMQRIFYPLLAFLVSLGRASFVPASLVAINLAGLGVIAASTAWLARRHDLAWWLPIAITAWPGFLVSLTHDTAEITAVALMLTALACYLSNRLTTYCVLAAAAALTRETTIPILLGVLAYEAYSAVTSPHRVLRVGRIVRCALPFVPFGVWWGIVDFIWNESPQSLGGNFDLGWPLVGVFTVLRANLEGTGIGNAGPSPNFFFRSLVILTACSLIAFCVAVATRAPRMLRVPHFAGLMTGWLLVLALMSLLTAGGPWTDPIAYFRAFTECWVVGCLLLAYGPAPRVGNKPLIFGAFAAIFADFIIWNWCFYYPH